MLTRVYQEPDNRVRSLLLKEYLCSISADQFPTAFDLCLKLEEDDTPDDILALLIRAWGEVDPEAAWVKCDQLVDTVMELNPLDVDSWETKIAVVNLPAVRAAHYWPSRTHIAEFLEGLEASSLPGLAADCQVAGQPGAGRGRRGA